MYDTFVAYGLQYLLHKRRMKFYRKTYATALLCEFLQHIGRILNAYFPEDKPAEIFLTAVQCGMPPERVCVGFCTILISTMDHCASVVGITPYFLKALSRVMISVKVPFALPYQATDRFAAVLRLQRSWQSKIYNRKESAMSKYVLKLLESYNGRERKIAVLRYNLEHPTTVSRAEQIEAMNFRHDDSLGHSAGHISNKTLYIALNYEEQAERMNAESAHEIAKELFALECEQRRPTYFIGLLDKRQAEVIRLVFVDGIPTKEVATSFGLTYRTIDRIKRTAIENLVEMYAYSDQFQV